MTLWAQELMELAEAIRPGSKLIAQFEKDRVKLERQMIPELMREFRALGSYVATASEGQGSILWESSGGERSRIERILQAARLGKWADEKLRPLFERQWRRATDATYSTLLGQSLKGLEGAEPNVTLRNELAQKLLDMGGKRVGLLDIDEDTRSALFRVLEEGRGQGLNPRATAKLIEEHVPAGRFKNAGPQYRAELIARTETLSAQRMSSLGMYQDSPVIKQAEAFDGDGDAVCIARNGSVYSLGDAEIEAESTHPNCVLAFAPVV